MLLQSFFMPFSCDGMPLASGALSQRATVCRQEKTRRRSVRQLAAEKKHTVASCDNAPLEKNTLSHAATTSRRLSARFCTFFWYYNPQRFPIIH
jgi:hypothetical protein